MPFIAATSALLLRGDIWTDLYGPHNSYTAWRTYADAYLAEVRELENVRRS